MDYSRLFNLLRCLCLFVSVLLSPTQSYSVSLSICHVALWVFSFFVSHYLVVSVFICLSVILRLSLPLCHSSPFSVFSFVSLVICLSVSAFLFLSLQFNRLLVLKSTQHTHKIDSVCLLIIVFAHSSIKSILFLRICFKK